MSKSTPSLLALLGLVAVAGYQNRGRISEMLSEAQKSPDRQGGAEGQGSFLDEIRQTFEGSSVGSALSSALSELSDRFRGAGRSDAADSWISTDANRAVTGDDLEESLGADNLDMLAQKSGLSRDEIKHRLATALPELVDRLTPQGRLPTEAEVEQLI